MRGREEGNRCVGRKGEKERGKKDESNERVTNLTGGGGGRRERNGRLYLLGFGGSPTIAVSARLYLTPWQPITNISELCRRVPFDTLREEAARSNPISPAWKTLREINCMRRVSPSIIPRRLSPPPLPNSPPVFPSTPSVAVDLSF